MAGAYAALMSLMHTSEMILHPSYQWLRLHRPRIESLLQKVRVFQEFLEDYSHRGHEEMAGLESQIADMAHAAEDIIESHVLDQNLARSTGSEPKSFTSFAAYIQKLIEEMEDLIRTKVTRIKEAIQDFEKDQRLLDFSPALSSRVTPNDQNTLVGSEEKLIEIMDRLTGQQSSRQIIAIVGMGGIGKTTLARNVYDHPHVVHHFHIRAWVTISQNYRVRKIILELLEIYHLEQESILSDDQLGERLYKCLSGMRYLIVMDDLWGTEVWDKIRAYFPDNRNGSRIMITTRLLNVARRLSSFEPFEMELLGDDQSWKLLCDKVFGDEGCPSELEKLGKYIAIKCRGLPLVIVVIAGLLAKSNRTQEFWEYVEENLKSVINSWDDENCLKILALSYKNLPIHLKPCFLYMVVAPKGGGFYIKYLTRLWVAEGFLKPIRAKTLEEVANEYIRNLIDRNLILVTRRGDLGRLEACGIHDLLRELCLREAQKENFLIAIDERNPDMPEARKENFIIAIDNCDLDIPLEIEFKRRLQFPLAPKKSTRSVLDLLRPASLTRSMIGEFGWTISLASSIRLLRVFYVETHEFLPNDKEIMQLVNLRIIFLFGKWNSTSILRFTSSISQFWSLQTLFINNISDKPIFLPPEIWDLPQLRHLHINRVVLPDPPCYHNDENDSHILENLHTLSAALHFRCTEEVLKRVPNLKKLEVTYDHLSPGVQWPYFCLHNLIHLHKLESLTFESFDTISLDYLCFPLSLKELYLSGCRLPWENMTIVGSLPNLEELVLLSHAFEGLMWCPVEGQFVRLKLLEIDETNLLHWRADKTQFPILEHLILRNLDLEEIPRDLGELPALRKIELFCCSDSAIDSAKQIREEQESLGNEGLQVIVGGKKI